jgi:hypothetical protein
MKRYKTKPRGGKTLYAARYVAGLETTPDEVLAVAKKVDPSAAVGEVASMKALVVRYLFYPGDGPGKTEYEVVPDGCYLVFSEAFDLLYVSTQQEFEQELETVR